jgi:putative holliday junction resolvase
VEILALDVGAKRVGIARASLEARLAQPFKTIKTEEAIEQLQEIIKANDVTIIVAGLPRNLSSEDTTQTRWVRNWVAKAKAELKLPFYWQDEALTSQIAESRKSKVENLDVDAEAAAIILEDFLNTDKNDRVLV